MSYVMILVVLIAVVIVVRNKKKASGSPPPRQQLPPAPDAPAPAPAGFGRKRVSGAAAPAPPAPERPFGEDIANPDSRTIPAALAGRWTTSGSPDDVLVIEPDHVVTSSGNERVIAVRFIGSEAGLDTTDNVAVVTRGADEQYALHYFGLRADGCLVDLESADVVRSRAD